MALHATLQIETRGRGFTEITAAVARVVRQQFADAALINVFIRHTSASLIICENADSSVLSDLERYIGDLVPDGDPRHEHAYEGPDDMPAHIRSVLTSSSLSIPAREGELLLGTWQGVFLWEHRHRAHRRELIVSGV